MKEFRGFFKIIPIAMVVIVIAAVIGLVGFGVQKCSADNLDEITSADITAEGMEQLGDMSTGYTNNEIGDTMPQVLINVRLRVIKEWDEFWADFKSDSPVMEHTDNAFFALLIALQSGSSEASDIAAAIDVIENLARELRAIQAGKKGFENDR